MGPDRQADMGGLAWRLSRRQLIGRGAAAVGSLALLGGIDPSVAFGRPVGEARPIPGGFDEAFNMVPDGAFIHVLPPGIGFEMATITDFDGVVGAAEIRGTAHGSDDSAYEFDCDMRFMRGAFVDLTGRLREGAFGFV
jgi:hypothetical protein